ncbi:MAG: aminoglycoside phosphotransferase family protein [Candidatus Bathyarchaeia archaeon]
MEVKQLLSKIKAEFPEIKWKRHRVITQGWDYYIVILDENIVFRFPKRPSDLRFRLYDEVCLLRYLRNKVDVGVPEYTHVFRDKSAAGYKLLSGVELKPYQYKRLLPDEKEMIARKIANFLSVLHATPKTIIKKCSVPTEKYVKRYNELVYDVKRLLFPRFSKDEVELIERYFEELKMAMGRKHPKVLVYNDLTWEHILWDKEKQQINIIDFGDCVLGDPAVDFAGLWEYGLDFTRKVFDFYDGEKDEHMLYRSQLYFKRIPLFLMKGSLQGWPCTFEDGYKMFRQCFKQNISEISQ